MPMKKYKEDEKEYSARNDIIDLAEWKRFCSHHKIGELQQGLIPVWLNFTWKFPRIDTKSRLYEDYCYFRNGVDTVSRDVYTTIVHIMGIGNNLFKVTDRFVSGYPEYLYKKKKINAFLVFLDNVFIPWSKYEIVKSDDKYAILFKDRDRDYPFKNIEILSIPFDIIYSENDETSEYARLFSFDKTGKFNLNGPIHVSSKNPNIGCAHMCLNSYNLTDMGIDTNRDIQLSNIYTFDMNGYMTHPTNNTDFVELTNLLTMEDGITRKRWVISLYSNESCGNEAFALRAKNKPFLKQLVKRQAGIHNFDYELVKKKYDCRLGNQDIDTKYEQSIDYAFWSDHNKLDKIYHDRKLFNLVKVENPIIDNGKVIITRDYYDTHPYKTYGIIFNNGIANHNMNNQISYFDNKMITSVFGSLNDLWVAYFHKNINGKYDVRYNNGIEYSNPYIPLEDTVVLTDAGDPDNLYPIEYTPQNGKLIIDPLFKDTKLYVCSRFQFVHKQYYITDNVLELDKEFETCYDHKKYMVFHEGRFINPRNYRVVRPNLLNKNRVRKSAIYFKFNPGPRRIIDVYYIGSLPNKPIAFNGDLLIDCRKAKAKEEGQKRFRVPYPFKNYPREYNSFFCIKNSLYMDKDRYKIDGDYIEFDNDEGNHFIKNEELVFVFPYYKDEWDWDGDIPDYAMIEYDYHMQVTTADTTTMTFPTYTDIVPGEAVMLFNNTTYMPPTNYSINGNVVTFGEVIPKDFQITLVVEKHKHPVDRINDIYIDTKVFNITQDTYELPIEDDFYDSIMLMYGSTVVSPDAYTIDRYRGVLEFTEESEGIPAGRDLFMFYFKSKDDVDTNTKRTHIKTEFFTSFIEHKTKTFNIPYQYVHPYKFEHNKMVLFCNSIYIDPSKYTVSNNVITLIDPDEWFDDNSNIFIMIAYREYGFKPRRNLGYKDVIWFQEVGIETILYQKKYKVPPPFVGGEDSPFIVTLGDTFIPEDWYTYDENTSILEFKDDYTNFQQGMGLKFTYIHNGGFSHFYKTEVALDVTNGQREVPIPAPYSNFVDFNRRMLVFLNTTYLDKDRYLVDNVNKKIILKEPIPGDNFQINFVFFYTGNKWNGLATYLPRSGYFVLRRDLLDRNMTNEMMMVFINGKLTEKEHIINISNTIFKVGIRPDDRRYDLCIIQMAPKIKELHSKYSDRFDDWEKLIDPIPISQ